MLNLRSITLAVALAAMLSAPCLALACTQQEAMAKGTQLSQAVQAKMAQDPQAGQAMMMRMQPIMQSYSTQMSSGGAVDWDVVCKQYDDLLAEAQK